MNILRNNILAKICASSRGKTDRVAFLIVKGKRIKVGPKGHRERGREKEYLMEG